MNKPFNCGCALRGEGSEQQRLTLGQQVNQCLLASLVIFLLLASQSATWAQNTRNANAPNDSSLNTPTQLHNRVVYVPYGELDRVFGDKHKGILLNYDKYQQLWTLAELRSPRKSEPPPPIAATVTAAEYQGTVTDDVADFEAAMTVQVLADKPSLCPLDFRGVGLASVSVDGGGASLVTTKNGLGLVTEGAGKKALTASFSVRVEKVDGRRSLMFAVPQVAASSIALNIPSEATVEGCSVPHTIKSQDGFTQIQLAVGGRSEIALTWKVKETQSEKKPVILVDSLLKLAIQPGTVRLDAMANVSVLRTPVSEIQFSLPEDFELVEYDVAQLKDIDTTTAGGVKTIRLTFHEPVTDTVEIRFAAETGLDSAVGGSVVFPQVRFLNAMNQKGQAEIEVHRSLFARMVTEEQARRVFESVSHIAVQTEQPHQPWRTYAIWRPDYRLVVEAKPVPLDTYAKVLSAFEVREQQMFLTSRILYQVNRGERHSVRLGLPQDWEILSIRHAEREVDWDESSDSGTRTIEVESGSRLTRGDTYVCEVRCRQSPDDWLTSAWESRTVSMPKVWVQDATTQDGILAVASDDAFELNDLDLVALKSMDTRNLSEMGYASAGLRLGYSYQREYSGSLDVTRRSPRIGAVVTQYVRMEPDVYRVHALVEFNIKHAATDTLWIELPRGIGKEVDISGPQIKERGLVEREGATGDVWKVGLYRKWAGPYRMAVSYERPIVSGKSQVRFGNIKALDIHRQSGFIAVEASSDIEVHPHTKNLIEVDVSQIPSHPTYNSVSRIIYAYKWLTPSYELLLDVIRHQEVNVLSTAVSMADYKTVVATNGTARTQVTLTVRNSSMGSLPVKLPAGSRLWSAISNGSPVKPALTGELIAIPIPVAEQQEKVFPVILTYESQLGGISAFGSLSLEGVRVEGVPVISTNWSLYLPPGLQYLGYGGNMQVERVPPYVNVQSNMRSLGKMINDLNFRNNVPQMSGAPRPADGLILGRWNAAYESSESAQLSEGEGDGGERYRGVAAEGEDEQEMKDVGIAGSVIPESNMESTAEMPENAPVDMMVNGAPTETNISERSPLLPQSGEQGAQQRIRAEEGPPMDSPPGIAVGSDSGGMIPGGMGGTFTGFYPTNPQPARRSDELKLMSMEIEIPASGTYHSFKRLGGNPRVSVRFVSLNAATWIGVVITVGFVFLSMWLCASKQMHPLFLSVVSVVLFVGLPMSVSEVLTPYCDAALFGVAIFVTYRFCRWLGRKAFGYPASSADGVASKPGAPLVTALMLAPALFGLPFLSADEIKGNQHEPKWMPDRTIYVPYDPKKKELPTKLDKVYLPYADFMDLWERANPDEAVKKQKSIVPYTISNAVYSGRLEGQLAVFDARFEIRTFSDEWTDVRLPLSGAIREAKLGQNKATLSAGKGSYALGLDKAGLHVLSISFAVPARSESGSGKFSFTVPYVPTSAMSFVLPTADLEAVIAPAHGGQRVVQVNGESVLQGKLGSVNSVTVHWSPKAGMSDSNIAAHVEVKNQSVVTLRQAYVEVRSVMALNVTRNPISSLVLQADTPLAVYRVKGGKVKGWAIEPDNPSRIRISFLESVIGQTVVQIDAGAKADGDPKPFGVPLISVADEARESGTVVLASQPDLKCEVLEATGLRRINLSGDLNNSVAGRNASPLCAFSYAGGPVSLRAKVEPAAREVSAVVDSLFSIDADETTLQSRFTLTVKKTPMFGAEVELPLMWKVREIKGAPVKEWWLTTEADVQRVNISFNSPVTSNAILALEAVSSSNGTDEFTFVNPKVRDTVEQSGTMVLAAFRDYTLQTSKVAGLRPLDIRQVSAQHAVDDGFTPVMAYSYVAPEHELSVARSEVTPMVTAASVTHVTVESGTMRCATTLRYDVSRAAIDTCEFSLPVSVGNQIDVKSSLVRQVRSSIVGEGDDARRVWSLKLHAPKTGVIDHSFTLELPLPDKADIRIPRPDILGVDRTRAYVILTNLSEYIVKDKVRQNIREVPLNELPFFPPGGQVNSAATAYQAQSVDWKLEFSKELTTMQELTEASVDWAEIQTSISDEGRMLSKVTYHMQNRTEQYLEIEMPDGADIWSVFVAGKPVRPAVIKRETRTNTLIPLVKTTAADLAFDVEVVYEHKLPAGFGTTGHEVMGGPRVVNVPVIKTLLTVYLPEDHRYFLFGGNVEEVISEVTLLEKVESLVQEQVQLLGAFKSRKSGYFSAQRAQYNLKKLDEKIGKALKEVEDRNDMRLRQSKRKELGRYQEKKFEEQIVSNYDDGVQLLQQWSANKVQQAEIQKQFAEQGQQAAQQAAQMEQSESQTFTLANIDQQRPDAPLLQCQAVFAAGNKPSAWSQLGPYRGLLKTHHRSLSPEFQAFIVEKLIEEREIPTAIEICRRLVASQGKGGLPHRHLATFQNLLGDCYMADERFELAREEYMATTARYPKSREAADAKLKIAETFLAQKVYSKADEILEDFSEETDLNLKAKAATLNAVVSQRQGEGKKALKFYEDAVNLNQMITGKNREGVQQELEKLLAQTGDTDKQKEALESLRLIGAYSGEASRTIEPGKPLRIRLSDRDLSKLHGMDRVPVTVTTSSGDVVHTILERSEAGAGLIVGGVETKQGEVNRQDNVLQVKEGDEITYRITDKVAELLKSESKPVPEGKVQVTGATGTGLPAGGGRGGGGAGVFFGDVLQGQPDPGQVEQPAGNEPPGSSSGPLQPEVVQKTGLLSIRVDIPQTSNVYHFKKLRGGAKVSFRHVSKASTEKLGSGAVMVLLLVAVFGAQAVIRKRGANTP